MINLGTSGVGGQGQGDAWIMDALNSMQARQRDQSASADAEAKFRAQEFAKRLAAYADQPDVVAKATAEFAQKDPAAAKLLTPYQQEMPQTAGMQLKQGANEWLVKMAPLVEKAYETDPASVNPQLLSLMRPFFSGGDKSMEPHEYDDLAQRYAYEHEGQLPPDYVAARKVKDKLQQTPEEIAQDRTVQRGQDLGLQGKKYEADTGLTGTKYTVDAKRPVYAAEAGELQQKGRMYGTRADMNAEDIGPDESQIDEHPLVQSTQAHINDLQKERDQAAAQAGNSKLTAQERKNARGQAKQYQNEIEAFQGTLTDIKTKMRKSLGIDDEGDEGLSTDREEGGGGGAAVTQQPQIRDMRGSNVPQKGALAARPGGGAPAVPAPQVGVPSVPSAVRPPQAQAPPGGTGPTSEQIMLKRQLIQEGALDPQKKTLTKAAAARLSQTGVVTSGWTVLNQ